MITNISAAILAGGLNSRLKKEKSLLKIGSNPLITEIADTLTDLFQELLIVSSKQELQAQLPHLKFVKDNYLNCGPLAGIQAALSNSSTEFVFICACDMPDLNETVINKMLSRAEKIVADVIVPRHQEGIEPLHAIYSQRCLPFIEKQLENKMCSIRSFYDLVKVEYLDFQPEEIKYFYNINTPQDLEKFLPGK